MIAASLQKVGLGNITPRHCNQVRLEELVSGGVVTMPKPVYINLKYLNRGENIVLKQVVDLKVSAEGGSLGVEGDGLAVGYVATAYGCLRSADITDETSVGGWHMV